MAEKLSLLSSLAGVVSVARPVLVRLPVRLPGRFCPYRPAASLLRRVAGRPFPPVACLSAGVPPCLRPSRPALPPRGSRRARTDDPKRDAFNLWLACYTQDEIAERVGWPRQTIDDWLKGIAEKPKDGKSGNTDADDSPFKLSDADPCRREPRDGLRACGLQASVPI